MEYLISYDSGSSYPFAVIGYPYLTFSLHAAGGLEVCPKNKQWIRFLNWTSYKTWK